jgi:hypothetical protein
MCWKACAWGLRRRDLISQDEACQFGGMQYAFTERWSDYRECRIRRRRHGRMSASIYRLRPESQVALRFSLTVFTSRFGIEALPHTALEASAWKHYCHSVIAVSYAQVTNEDTLRSQSDIALLGKGSLPFAMSLARREFLCVSHLMANCFSYLSG